MNASVTGLKTAGHLDKKFFFQWRSKHFDPVMCIKLNTSSHCLIAATVLVQANRAEIMVPFLRICNNGAKAAKCVEFKP